MSNAEIIAIGSELLTPQRIDTNSLFLTEQLNAIGAEVTAKHIVGDHRERLADVLHRALARADLVILSGGLGPTEDDVTRDAVAMALDRKLIFRPEICDGIETRFRQAGRRMAEINKRQAYLVQGADVLPNDRGTAPGQWIEDGGRCLMLLPGPPNELKAMFTRQCLPRLERRLPRQIIRTLVFRATGISESELDQTIAPVYTRYTNPVTTILAHASDLQIHLRARCATEKEAAALLQEVGAQIEILLGDRIYSRNGETLEAAVGEMLKRQRATLAIAESATGGGLGQRITEVAGASEYFAGGFITYTAQLKRDLLGVLPEILAEFGPISKECASAMAAGARLRTGATYGLAITGNAGPGTDGPKAPAGAMYVALADANGTQAVHRQFFGDRGNVRLFAAQMALDLLRRHLEKVVGKIAVV